MAEAGRTVRVGGLPADVDEARLKDKLLIHFLRARNGGGEIEAITILRDHALIVFEESEVAKTVVERSPHVLEVSGKKYNLSVTEYCEILDPDKVVTRLSAVVDYRRVPGGALALRRLQEDHPDVRLGYDAVLELYTLSGAYSKVQAALTQLFGPSGNQQADAVRRAASGSWSERLSQKLAVNPSEDLSAKPSEHAGHGRAVDTLRSPELKSGSQRETRPGAYGVDDPGWREGAAPQLAWPPEEDSFLMVDADMFQYVQKYCQKDYRQILGAHGVEAVEVTNQGLTSLYLQTAAGVGANARDGRRLSSARNAMSHFFQESEAKICRAEFSKSSFPSGKDLRAAKDSLNLRHPKILLKEDDANVYMIGSSRDVYDAKQFLLDQRLDQFLKSEGDETREDAARRCKLAPRFKESGLPSLGSRPADFSLRGGPTAQGRPKCPGPMLGFNVLSEPSRFGERVPRGSAQTAGEDVLFKGPSSWSPAASAQNNDASFSSDVTKSRPKTAQNALLPDSALLPPAGSGSARRRANSFSGTPQREAQLAQQRSRDDATEAAVGAGATPSDDHLAKDGRVGYTAEMAVSSAMWQYIKDVYGAQVDDLTSDVQTREAARGGSDTVAVTLRAGSPSTLKSCRLGLQRLIDVVGGDFSVLRLPLSELGLADPADETLLACCNNARGSFRAVALHVQKKHVLLLGPKLLCSQVAASLLEVFSRDLTQMSKKVGFSTPSTSSTSKSDPATPTHTSEDQSAKLHSHSKNPASPGSSRGTTDGAGIDRERTDHSGFGETEHVNGSAVQPRQYKDPVMKEKVRCGGTRDRNGQKSSAFVSKTGDDEEENHVKSVTGPGEDASLSAKESLDSSLKDSAQQKRKESEESRSGAEARALRRGVCGQMSCSTLNIHILGHKNDSTIKVKYSIPDGIQEEGHPSPGKPFQGGVFEAYFPNTETTRRLLPRLEQAFKQGLTFTVVEKETGAKVAWSSIPHKTTLQGGKSGYGYPDSRYLDRLAEVLALHGIKEPPAKFK